jgi:hypothetical protein
MGLELLTRISDRYERKARLYPALLSLIPILALVIGVYVVEFNIRASFIGLLATFGVFYLITSIVRDLGKRLEPSLFLEWGGKPTTQILRHRDKTIDSVTKKRYHTFLGKHLDVTFPSKVDEDVDPSAADEKYISGVRWLLDKTRDTQKFNLIFQENIAFGFRRNCLGVKPYAVAIALMVCAWILFLYEVVALDGIDLFAIKTMPFGAWGTIILSLLMTAIWLFFFNRKMVRTSAFTYAEMLLRACDVLPKRR